MKVGPSTGQIAKTAQVQAPKKSDAGAKFGVADIVDLGSLSRKLQAGLIKSADMATKLVPQNQVSILLATPAQPIRPTSRIISVVTDLGHTSNVSTTLNTLRQAEMALLQMSTPLHGFMLQMEKSASSLTWETASLTKLNFTNNQQFLLDPIWGRVENQNRVALSIR